MSDDPTGWPSGPTRRSNWNVLRNTATLTSSAVGSSTDTSRGVMFFSSVDGVHVHGNVQNFSKGGPGASQSWMRLGVLGDCTVIDINGNSGTNLLGQFYSQTAKLPS